MADGPCDQITEYISGWFFSSHSWHFLTVPPYSQYYLAVQSATGPRRAHDTGSARVRRRAYLWRERADCSAKSRVRIETVLQRGRGSWGCCFLKLRTSAVYNIASLGFRWCLHVCHFCRLLLVGYGLVDVKLSRTRAGGCPRHGGVKSIDGGAVRLSPPTATSTPDSDHLGSSNLT